MAQATQQGSKKPAHEIRYGSVKALIWENAGQHGAFYRFTVERLYKDGVIWKSSTTFGANDIPKLASVLVQVEDWLKSHAGAGEKTT